MRRRSLSNRVSCTQSLHGQQHSHIFWIARFTVLYPVWYVAGFRHLSCLHTGCWSLVSVGYGCHWHHIQPYCHPGRQKTDKGEGGSQPSICVGPTVWWTRYHKSIYPSTPDLKYSSDRSRVLAIRTSNFHTYVGAVGDVLTITKLLHDLFIILNIENFWGLKHTGLTQSGGWGSNVKIWGWDSSWPSLVYEYYDARHRTQPSRCECGGFCRLIDDWTQTSDRTEQLHV
jgi:hypothetical protein